MAVGRRVIARHPKTRTLHDGTILTANVSQRSYLVLFDRQELGSQHVRDMDVMPECPFDYLPRLLQEDLHRTALAPLPLPRRRGLLDTAGGAASRLGLGAVTQGLSQAAAALDQREAMMVQLRRMGDAAEGGASGPEAEELARGYAAIFQGLRAQNPALQAALAAARPPAPAAEKDQTAFQEAGEGAEAGQQELGAAAAAPGAVEYIMGVLPAELNAQQALQSNKGYIDLVAQRMHQAAALYARARVSRSKDIPFAADGSGGALQGDGGQARQVPALEVSLCESQSQAIALMQLLQLLAEHGPELGPALVHALLDKAVHGMRPRDPQSRNLDLYARLAEAAAPLKALATTTVPTSNLATGA